MHKEKRKEYTYNKLKFIGITASDIIKYDLPVIL
jgi:DNA topoisomerase VI subunit A